MTRVYLIRHAEAEGNVYRRAQGQYDSYITKKGERQIAALAERFKDEHIDALYSSDLRRTMKTAGAITKYHDLKLNTDPRLREVSIGSWEDRPWGNLALEDPKNMWFFNNDPANWKAEGGEGYENLQRRMYEAVNEIAARHDGQTIVCVSHGTAIRSLICKIKNVASADITTVEHGDNTCVSLLEIDGSDVKIVYYNDNSHLPKKMSTFANQAWWQHEDSVDKSNLWFAQLDPQKESELYCRCYSQAWQHAHNTLEGFQPKIYLSEAILHRRADPFAVLKAMQNEEPVGMIDLDPIRGTTDGYGWISLIYVEEEKRRMQLGVQLLGHAIAFFRKRSMAKLRLHVASENESAIAFYEEYGFSIVTSTKGVFGPLLLMERDI